MTRTPFIANSRLNPTGIKRGTKGLNRAGKKGKAWAKLRRVLKCEFAARGLTICELQLPGCWHDNGLGFAHRYKRNLITSEDELRVVILACNPCHDVIEIAGHAKMKKLVDGVIRDRELRLTA